MANQARPSEYLDGKSRVDLLEELLRLYGDNGIATPLRRQSHLLHKRLAWILVARGASVVKRIIDVVVSLIMLVCLSPLFLMVALLIKLTNPGPVLFWQTRVGKWGREFRFPKFRSMVTNAEQLKTGLQQESQHTDAKTFKIKRDPRITPIGSILRKVSIDELPQLWCVLKGDMSLVGPRPPVPREVALYTLSDRRRLDVIPRFDLFLASQRAERDRISETGGAGRGIHTKPVSMDRFANSPKNHSGGLVGQRGVLKLPAMIPIAKHNKSESTTIADFEKRFSAIGRTKRRLRRTALGVGWRFGLLFADSAKRLIDVTIAALGLIGTSPFFLVLIAFAWIDGGGIFDRERKIGRWAVPFDELEFPVRGKLGSVLRRSGMYRLPLFLNVLRGEMSLIGPRALSPGELNLREHAARKRSGVRPGLLSPWWLRKKANIDFGSEFDVDLEYIEQRSVGRDLGIAVRALPAIFYGSDAAVAPERVDVLGISVDNLTMDEALDYILDSATSTQARQICFVNTDCINKSHDDASYANCLRSADLILADGIGIRLAGKILRRQIRQNVNGTDLFPRLCGRLRESSVGLYLLGGRPGVAQSVAEWIEKNHPGAAVKGYRDGYFSPAEEAAVLRDIRNSGAEILLVAFGAPRQDLWIAEHLAEMGPRVAFPVGGLFDFYSARIPRAPQWARELSVEWIYRLIQEPKRMWRRYLIGNGLFLLRVIVSTFSQPTSAALKDE